MCDISVLQKCLRLRLWGWGGTTHAWYWSAFRGALFEITLHALAEYQLGQAYLSCSAVFLEVRLSRNERSALTLTLSRFLVFCSHTHSLGSLCSALTLTHSLAHSRFFVYRSHTYSLTVLCVLLAHPAFPLVSDLCLLGMCPSVSVGRCSQDQCQRLWRARLGCPGKELGSWRDALLWEVSLCGPEPLLSFDLPPGASTKGPHLSAWCVPKALGSHLAYKVLLLF